MPPQRGRGHHRGGAAPSRGVQAQARCLPGATALAPGRASGAFTTTHDEFWAAARIKSATLPAPGAGRVLLLHRSAPRDSLLADIRPALNEATRLAEIAQRNRLS